jgi:hypothetical protein
MTNRWAWAVHWRNTPPKELKPIWSPPHAANAVGSATKKSIQAWKRSAKSEKWNCSTRRSELGIREVNFLDYIDGDLDQADPAEAITKIVSHLKRIRPHVVITFDPNGAYGHPDHIAICQFTTAAVLAAADPRLFQYIHSTPVPCKNLIPSNLL